MRVPLRVPVVAKKGVTAIIPDPQGFKDLFWRLRGFRVGGKP